MKQMLSIEFRNCINRREFKIVFLILFLISIAAYLIECFKYYGGNLSSIRSAYDACIVKSSYSLFIIQFEAFLAPILALPVYSDSYYTDCRCGVHKYIMTRTNMKTYIASKGIIIFTVTFFIFFIPLLINQLLAFIAFPLNGYDNIFGLPLYYLYYNKEYLFDFIRLQWPYLFNLIWMFFLSLFAGLFALLGYSMYFIFKKNRISVLIGLYMFFVLSELLLALLGFYRLSLLEYMFSTTRGYPLIMVLWVLVLLIPAISIIATKGVNDEPDISKK
ncbi:MAG: hypothetical protein PHQ09_03480 [Actinomycetota bacterium]|nr:hypothetical protein [Actinomycetota bacterium]